MVWLYYIFDPQEAKHSENQLVTISYDLDIHNHSVWKWYLNPRSENKFLNAMIHVSRESQQSVVRSRQNCNLEVFHFIFYLACEIWF